eukprot:scaffold9535_cov160-Skeletonema_marinoi.AAC.1
MANELIVDFPEQSHSHDMCPPNRDRDGNDQAVSRGSSPHQAFSHGHSRRERSHRHGQPEMSNHRSSSRSWNNDSSNDRCHSSRSRRSSDPSLAGITRSVHFAETSSLKFVTKHEDREDVNRQDLWYSQSDIDLMKIAAQNDILEVRDKMASGVPIDYILKEDDDNTVCLMGIENRHTAARAIEVKVCRARCVIAVLQEQEGQQMMDLSTSLFPLWHRQDLIALASFSQTRKAAFRARKLALLHEECVMNCSR